MKQRMLSLRRIVCVVMVAAILLIGCMPVYAADRVSASALAQRVNVKGIGYTNSTYTVYQVTVPSAGYITFRNNHYSTSPAVFRLYKKVNDVKNGTEEFRYLYMYKNQKTASIPVGKGTYYIYPDNTYDFRYTFTKATAVTKNYKVATALALNSNEPVIINSIEGYQKNRWYRFRLTKQSDLTVYFRDMMTISKLARPHPVFTLYGPSSQKITYNKQSGFNYTFSKLPKGTYYIRVSPGKANVSLYQLKWQ